MTDTALSQLVLLITTLVGFALQAYRENRNHRWSREERRSAEGRQVERTAVLHGAVDGAASDARSAYREANNVNGKIEALHLRLLEKSDTTGGTMKFNLHKFMSLVTQLAPIVLGNVQGGSKIITLIPTITNAIIDAEQIAGATGAEKKAHVLAIAAAGVATANATGKVTLDPAEIASITSHGIDAVIGAAHVVHAAGGPTSDTP